MSDGPRHPTSRSGEGDRGRHMGLRLRRTARNAGIAGEDLDFLERLHATSMTPRREAFEDDHHPLFLHPGRSALVLLLDAGASTTVLLGGALVVDTARPELEPEADAVEALGPPAAEVLALRRAVPRPGAPDLVEALVVASEAVRLVSLAERLDHLRHLHLVADRPEALRVHREAVRVYAPVAERTHPVLARRYRWWCRTFARREG